MTHDTRPDWNVAIIDGQPELMFNLPAVAELVRHSPLGRRRALARLRRTGSFTPEHIARIKDLLGGAR